MLAGHMMIFIQAKKLPINQVPVGGLPAHGLTAHVVVSCRWCVCASTINQPKPNQQQLSRRDHGFAQTRVTKGSLQHLKGVQSDCSPDATPHLGFVGPFPSPNFLPGNVAHTPRDGRCFPKWMW